MYMCVFVQCVYMCMIYLGINDVHGVMCVVSGLRAYDSMVNVHMGGAVHMCVCIENIDI